MKKYQLGFSTVEILISVVVVIAVGAVGFYVYNSYQNRTSLAETINKEPIQVDAVTELTSLDASQKAEAGRTYTKVIDDATLGQVFACKVNANFWDGIKYYFTSSGTDSRKAWVSWDSHIAGGGLGAGGRSPKLQYADKVKKYKPEGNTRSDFINSWRFSMKNSSNKRVDSPWLSQKKLSKCP